MNKKSIFLQISGAIFLSLSLAAVASVPSVRQWLRDRLIISNRIILAKADGYLTSNLPVTVVKVKTADTLSLEIYSRNINTDTLSFFKRIVLDQKRDAHFTYRGNATNLVLTDLEGDGNIEIIAPAFDENLIPRLNVFAYIPESGSFTKLGEGSIQL